MRVFAGPNGSGKSSIIKSIRSYKTEQGKLDFGIYVNADDIVVHLKNTGLNLSAYEVNINAEEFQQSALASGLINKKFNETDFNSSFQFVQQKIVLKLAKHVEELGQIIAHVLRIKLLAANKKFSFETVFSHESKLQIMQEAKNKGYKVYLYFVSTNSPEINKERVLLRVKQGGHNVAPDKIESRYYRSLNLLFDSAQIAYQTFFFDNSGDKPDLFTNFKIVNGKKQWKRITQKEAPDWFIKYYANKIKRK